MKSNVFVKIFIIINLFFGIGISSALEPVQSENAQYQHIRVGIFQNYPLVYESDGLLTGFHLELLKEIAQHESWVLEYVFLGSTKNVLEGLQYGNLDIGMSLVSTQERKQFLDFTKEKNAVLKGQIIANSADSGISSMRDLEGKTIAVVNQDIIGKNAIEMFERLGIKVNSRQVRSNDEMVQALITRTVDAGICNNLQCEKYAKQYHVQTTSIIFEPTAVQFAVLKGKNKQIIETIDQYLHKWKMTTGSIYYEMEKSFLPAPSASTPKYTNRELLMALGIVLLFVLFGVLLGNFMATETEAHHGSISATHTRQIIEFVFALSISFWVMDSFVQWLLFNDGQDLSLLELAITKIPLNNLYIRGMFFLVCCFCGLFLARYLSKYEKVLNIVLASVNRFQQLTDNAKDMIFRMTLPDGEYEFVSKASSDIFGYSPEDFYKRPMLIESLIHPDWKKYFLIQWKNLLAGNSPPYHEYQIINKAGEVRWVNQRNTIYFDESGVPSAIEGIVTDVTDQKNTP
jgi:PAS domain S-box-containing protein